MFTGLIETITKVTDFSQTSKGAVIEVEYPFYSEVKIGDSISINGVCLTVIKINGNILSFEISRETLLKANFSNIKKGDIVNMERAMAANSRFDGHIVSGHIDGIAAIKNIKKDGFSYRFEFEAEKEITRYIIKKGSVTINGISLTVVDIFDTIFSVEVIPHTLNNTNLSKLNIGDKVNVETDIMARYVEKFLSLDKNNSKISMELLKDNGYL